MASEVDKKRRQGYNELRAIVISLLRERDGDDCALCGAEMAYDDMSIDHVEQVGQGGAHEGSNVQLAHLTCNQRKGRKLTEDDVVEIREFASAGISFSELGRLFAVDPTHVSRIVKGVRRG